MYRVGDTRLFFTRSTGTERVHDKEGIGLNHMAFGVRTLEDLKLVETQLNDRQIVHSGIMVDRYGLKEFIWLDDPDGMRIEFYLRDE